MLEDTYYILVSNKASANKKKRFHYFDVLVGEKKLAIDPFFFTAPLVPGEGLVPAAFPATISFTVEESFPSLPSSSVLCFFALGCCFLIMSSIELCDALYFILEVLPFP